MIKTADTLIELIFRNYCYKHTTCTGCGCKHENARRFNLCLISKICVMDLLEKDINCQDCIFEAKECAQCLSLDESHIKRLSLPGYWRFCMNE